MKTLVTVAPVFFMLIVGFMAKRLRWIAPEQEAGLKSVIFTVLFPIMVFNALFTTTFRVEHLFVILFLFAAQMLAIGVGIATGKFTAGRFAHISRYLTATSDGGNACYPLYATVVGAEYIGNVVLFDIATLFIVFLIIPMMVSAQAQAAGSEGGKSLGALVNEALTSSTVIAMLAGLVLSLLGVYNAISTTAWGELYSGVATMATQSIAPMILFTLGYDFELDRNVMAPLAKTLGVRIAYMALLIVAFFLLFPNLVADPVFRMVVLLYPMCPPAFVMPAVIDPICKDDQDRGFASAFISLNMVWTIIVFTVLVAVMG